MRKRVIHPDTQSKPDPEREWLDLENIAEVEITSEDSQFPVESALLPGNESGWRASLPGEQVLRIHFDMPQPVQLIRLHFHEGDSTRTQEYVLRCSSDGGESYQEIVRQQWNFSPDGATDEIEEYTVDHEVLTDIELSINPDISGKESLVSLKSLRLA